MYGLQDWKFLLVGTGNLGQSVSRWSVIIIVSTTDIIDAKTTKIKNISAVSF